MPFATPQLSFPIRPALEEQFLAPPPYIMQSPDAVLGTIAALKEGRNKVNQPVNHLLNPLVLLPCVIFQEGVFSCTLEREQQLV